MPATRAFDVGIIAAAGIPTLIAVGWLLTRSGFLPNLGAVLLVGIVGWLLFDANQKSTTVLAIRAEKALQLASGRGTSAETLSQSEPLTLLDSSLQSIREQHESLLAFADPQTREDPTDQAASLLQKGPLGPAVNHFKGSLAQNAQAQADMAKLFSAALTASSDAIVVVDERGAIMLGNAAAEEELQGSRQTIERLIPNWRDLSEKPTEFVRTMANGHKVHVEVTSATVDTTDGVRTAISWRERDQTPMRIQSSNAEYNDQLTGLLSRSGLIAALAQRRGQAIVAINVDLEGFQEINHHHGYDCGDLVLTTIARRLLENAPKSSLVGRTTGHEFMLVFEGSAEDGQKRAARITEAVRSPVTLPGGERVAVQMRTGWAAGIADAETTVLTHSTFALQEAKSSHVMVQAYTEDIAERVAVRRRRELELRTAVAEGQFVLYGQPVIDVFERRVMGVEMLVRWQHPSGELLSPGDFIPIAERIGLIDQIDRWVLQKTCEHAKSMGSDMHFSLNLSNHFISRPEAPQFVIDTLAESGLAAGRVLIELKEGSAPIDAGSLSNHAAYLQANGVHTALDNFGTGYSSIATLLQTPVSTIKLGRGLVDLVSGPDGRGVIGAILAYAKQRNLQVIAEGVETANDAEVLRKLGCRFQQGYFHQRPGPIEEILVDLPGAIDAFEKYHASLEDDTEVLDTASAASVG